MSSSLNPTPEPPTSNERALPRRIGAVMPAVLARYGLALPAVGAATTVESRPQPAPVDYAAHFATAYAMR